jgi:hypothetical protein
MMRARQQGAANECESPYRRTKDEPGDDTTLAILAAMRQGVSGAYAAISHFVAEIRSIEISR